MGWSRGPQLYENKPIPVSPAELDFVLITHAHIDHSGNLPMIYAHGFRGDVYMTEGDGGSVQYHASGQRAYPDV